MHTMITGHRGYIGSILTPLIQGAGHEVVGYDADFYEGSTFAVDDPIVAIPYLKKDIRDAEIGDFEGVEAVIHLAGLANDPLGDLNPELTYEINYGATVRIAELAKAAGVKRFLLSSSCSNYGAAGEAPLDETSQFNPVTPYARSKVMAEQGLAQLADSNFSPTFLRSATAYGVSPRLRFDLVLNNLVAWAFTTGRVYMKSDGTPWRPIVHVEDISRAFLAVLNAPRELVHGEAFNVGRPEENYRIRQLAEIVTTVVKGSRVEYAPFAGPDKRCYRVDCTKIAETLPAFRPQWTARRGVLELLAAFESVGLQLEDFEGPRYQRVAHIKKQIEQGQLNTQLRCRPVAVV